ncbi:hypothetical protein ABPG72_008921 [Tetrahymena utriculariae]
MEIEKEYTLEYIKTLKIQLIPHPPSSPDLNPIEQIWNVMKKKFKIRVFEEQITKKADAIKALHEIWDSISDEIVSNTIDQINVNLREVSANNGEIFIEF